MQSKTRRPRLRAAGLALATLLALPAVAEEAATDPAGEWCKSIGRRLSSVPTTTCTRLGLQPSGAVSTQGRPLMIRDFPPAPTKVSAAAQQGVPRPTRILVIGGIHGDELTSAAIVFRWMQWLDEPEARPHHWRIAPVANPDGLLASPPQRVNAHGVDLNRNFPTPDWFDDAMPYWTTRTGKDPRRFPGEQPMSEPETRWLHDEIEAFHPDVIVSIHAPYGILDYDGPARQPRHFGHLVLNRLGIYPGSLGNFGGIHKNVPVITIELPNANRMPQNKEMRQIWTDMLVWIRKNIVPQTLS